MTSHLSHFHRSSLCWLALLGLAAPLMAQTINSRQVLERGAENSSTYLIAADAVDGVAATNRHRVRCSSIVTFPSAGTYRLRYQLLNQAGETVAEEFKSLGAVAAGATLNDTTDLTTFPTRLSAYEQTRLKVEVSFRQATGSPPPLDFIWLPATSSTEATGRTYYHFPSTTTGDAARNVIAQVTGGALAARRYLADTVSGTEYVLAVGAFRLRRYDAWDSIVNPPTNIAVTLELELRRESDDALVQVRDGSGQAVNQVEKDFTVSVNPWVDEGGIKTPVNVLASDVGLFDLRLDPAGWLDFEEQYYVRIRIKHEETAGQPKVLGNHFNTAASQFFHFNGALTFGSIQTGFTALNGAITTVNTHEPRLNLPVAVDAGFLQDAPGHTFGTGASLTVVLENGGTADFRGVSVVVTGPAEDRALVNGVQFERTNLLLNQAGLSGNVSAWLPVGSGYSTTLGGNVLQNRLGPSASTGLGQTLQPLASVSFPGAPSFYVHEETKPVKIAATSITWSPSLGRFTLNATAVHSVRKPLLDALETVPNLPNGMKSKVSNDAYWNEVGTINTTPYLATTGTGAAELHATVGLTAGRSFTTHFPKNTHIAWNTGSIQIQADQINPAASTLEGVASAVVMYARHSSEVLEKCPGAGESFLYYRVNPDASRLTFTQDGGLHGAGGTAFSHLISWGVLNAAAPPAHEALTPFSRASFLMSGHFLKSNLLAFANASAPGYLHLRGVNPADLTQTELPGSAAYEAGAGDYAGINLRAVGSDALRSFNSRLGGSLSDPYTLADNAKFYLRYSGVSGVLQAPGGLSSASGMLLGYPVIFETFALNWMSNVNLLSRTDGLLQVPPPSDFTLAFDDLKFNSLGAPSIGGIAEGESAGTLAYWQGPFNALGIEFRQNDECDPTGGSLTVAMRLSAKNISQPLVGSLGFRQNGQIIRPADHLSGITSELPLPAVFYIDGPKLTADSPSERYAFTPVRQAYLNHEAADTRPPGADRVGFWSIAGKMDVPFFEDLKAHAHTSANPAEPLASLHLMGGWGDLFTERDFDGSHLGFDPALNPATYRSSSAHRVHARQKWLGLIDFDYPLLWNSPRRVFKSPSTIPADLLVLNAQHRVDYLSARQAEISFGVEYTGLPRISLSNALTNLVDENIGVASSIARTAGDEVLAGIESGVNGFADILADRLDALVGEAVDGVITPGLNVFYDNVKAAAADAITTQGDVRLAVKSVVDAYLRPAGGGGGAGGAPPPPPAALVALAEPLSSLVGEVGAPAGLVPALDGRLDGIALSLHAFAGDANDLENPLPGAGLLGRDGFGNRALLDGLVQNLVGDLAPQYLGVISNAPRFNLIRDAEGALAQIQTSMGQILAAVTTLRSQLDPLSADHSFLDQLTDLQSQLDVNLEEIVLNALADAVQAHLDRVFDQAEATFPTAAAMNAYLDRQRAQIENQVRQELLTRLMATPAIRGVQEALRLRLQVVHLAYREAVDSAFEEVNQIIRRALAGALAGLDDTLNSYASEIGNVLKTGRVTGHAHIQDDALRELRLDALLQMGIPDDNPLRFDGFVRFQQLDGVGPGGCPGHGDSPAPISAGEVTLGARDASLEWLTSGLRADVQVDVGFYAPGGAPIPISVGGRFETTGTMRFGGAEVTNVKGIAKVGLMPVNNGGNVELVLGENYVGLSGAVKISGSGLEGAIFLGRSCSMEPILFINPQLGDLLGAGGFTGGYVYGAGRIPIVDFGCLLNLSAGVGAGVFYAAEGPTWGGQINMSASGEALCVISVRGDVDLIGVKRGDDFRFSGQGRIKGKVGVCPFCKKFSKTVRFTYQGGSWDADY
jgi:hypothetical protein